MPDANTPPVKLPFRADAACISKLWSAAPLVIIGMTAVGKSSIGRSISALAGLPFIDSDEEIERQTGIKASHLIRTEEIFRKVEHEVALSLLNSQRRVVALGGGAWIDNDVRIKAQKFTTTVWLDLDTAEIKRRVKEKGRVVALNPDGTDRVDLMLSKRLAIYAEADVHVKLLPEDDIDQNASKVMEAICVPDDLVQRPGSSSTF